jgi:hypothetical protein
MQENEKKSVNGNYQVINMKGREVQVKKTCKKIQDRIWQKHES